MKKFLVKAGLFLVGVIIGFLMGKNQKSQIEAVVREPNESEIMVFLEKQEAESHEKWDEIAQSAIEGDKDSTWKMFSRYTFGDHDYERAYYWAVLLERQGFDPKQKGEYIANAEINIKAGYWSRTRDPDRGKEQDPRELEGLLPPPKE